MRPLPEISVEHMGELEKEFVSTQKPVVIRGLVANWPVTAASDESAIATLKSIGATKPSLKVGVVEVRSREGGEIGYTDDGSALNFTRSSMVFDRFIRKLESFLDAENAMSLALQSAYLDEVFPALELKVPSPPWQQNIRPRVWIGNRSGVRAHFDDADNIACVAMGRRRFTLFPPGQIENLYIGPIDHTPAGAPTSMPRINADLARYPKLEKAHAAGLQAELAPGDAIFIPALWWHQVEALSGVNMLVNYWWGGALGGGPSVFDAMLHTLSVIQELPAAKREAWGQVFDYFVFRRNGDPTAHIPKALQGVLGGMTDEQRIELNSYLASRLHSKRQ